MAESSTERGYESGQQGAKVKPTDNAAIRDGKLASQKDANKKNGR